MLNMRKSSIVLGVVLVLLCAGSALAANTFQISDMEAGRYSTAVHPFGGPTQITQNDDPATVSSGSSVACVGAGQTTDTGAWRQYDLNGDHGLSGEVCVKSVDFGIETSTGGPQEVTLFVGCSQQNAPVDGFIDLTGSVTQVGGGTVSVADGDLVIPITVTGDGCCDADVEDMVIGLISPDCQEVGCGALFFGANGNGQSAPSYIAAPDCGIVDPVDWALIGFSGNVVQVVTVNAGGGPGTPAATGIGMLLMVLLLIGSSAYFMRRRVTN
jgi:hypothetical protein